jgi:hypothetical protein
MGNGSPSLNYKKRPKDSFIFIVNQFKQLPVRLINSPNPNPQSVIWGFLLSESYKRISPAQTCQVLREREIVYAQRFRDAVELVKEYQG